MFFYLSKILFFLLTPFYWLIACLLLAWGTRNVAVRKKWLIAAGSIFLLFGNTWIYKTCLKAWQAPVNLQLHARPYPAAIVLSGMVMTDKKQQTFFGNNADRFLQTAQLYHTGTVKQILISGGTGSLDQTKPKEADWLMDEFKKTGIPAEALIKERDSRNTFESALACKKIITSLGIKDSCILVTSATHMRRALLSFAKAGVAVKPHVANFEVLENSPDWKSILIPDPGILTAWPGLLKEIIGLMVYKITGKA